MDSIIITSLNNKKRILKSNFENKLLCNVKFYTFSDLKKKLFFDYNYNTLAFIMSNYHVSLAVAKIYLNNLYFLKDINNDKINFLMDLKRTLDKEKLLIYDNDFKEMIKRWNVKVYGYDILTKEQKLILDNLNVNYELENNISNNYIPKIYEAKDMDEEVLFVITKIMELLSRGILINNIKIIATNGYDNILDRYFYLYNIPFNKNNNHSFYSTLIAKEFLNNYNNLSINDNINALKDKFDNINDLITIINKSVMVEDKKTRLAFIINDLKQTMLKEEIYDNAVSFGSIDDIYSSNDYVFLLGFNIEDYPKIKRDTDYLSDDIKGKLGLDTSTFYNNYQSNYLLKQLCNIKNLIITYKLSGNNGKCYPSILISKLGIEIKNININNLVSYSKLDSEIKYANALDNLYKYNIMDNKLGLYQNSLDIPYFKYDNQFKGIDKLKIYNKLNNSLTLSYTNLEMYQECSFKYYISKILNLDIFEETFKTIIGTIMHHILELGIIKEINIPVEIISFVKEKGYNLNAKEMFYLEEFSNELADTLKVIKEQEKHSKLRKYLFENEFYVYKDRSDIKITFKGNIDKVMYENINNKEIIAVVDYKTGNTKISLDGLEYGLYLQLPIYLYLLRKSDRFANSLIAGFYIQKVLPKKEKIQFKKTKQELLESGLRLQGFTNADEKLIELIDDDYQSGKIIQNLQFKKDGSISSKSKVLTNKDMDDLIYKVDIIIDGVINNILNAKFLINPKVLEQKNIACKYCKFKDLCFMRKQNEVDLGGDKFELDRQAGISN